MATKLKDPPTAPRSSATPASGAGGAPAPMITPEQVAIKPPGTNGTTGPGAPAMQPPGTEAAGMAAQAMGDTIAAWVSATVGGLWTSNNTSNAYAYLNGIGWRKLSPANQEAHQALLEMARVAKDGNLPVQCDDDGSVIHAMYVW